MFAVALLAILPLQGCFNATEDREFTVKKGEMISAFDMEVAPDGSVLLLAKIGMYYSREGVPSEYERSNLHTVLFRRSNGAWSATPFKNLQSYEEFFPSFIRDRDGGFRVLVLDAGRAKSFGLRGDRWEPQANIRSPGWFGGYNTWDPSKNWNRHPLFGYKNDSTLYQSYWEDDGTAKIRDGRGQQNAHTLGFGFVPLAFHAGNGYSALFGMERDTGYQESVSHPALHHWREDPEDMVSIRLDSLIASFQDIIRPENGGLPGKSPPNPAQEGLNIRPEWQIWPSETFFAPYRDGTGLYYCRGADCRILVLDASGMPAGIESPATDPGSLEVSDGSRIAPDTGGCLHGVEHFVARDSGGSVIRQPGPTPMDGAVVIWDACRGEKDTVVLWESPADEPFFLMSPKIRLLPDGSPVIAAVVQELKPYSHLQQPDAPLARTWLILAEKKQGAWSTAIVDRR